MRLTANPMKSLRSERDAAAAKVDRLKSALGAEQDAASRAELAKTSAISRLAATADESARKEVAEATARAESARVTAAAIEAALRDAEAELSRVASALAVAEEEANTRAEEEIAAPLRRQAEDLVDQFASTLRLLPEILAERAVLARKVAALAPRAEQVPALTIGALAAEVDCRRPGWYVDNLPLRVRDAEAANLAALLSALVALDLPGGKGDPAYRDALDHLGLGR